MRVTSVKLAVLLLVLAGSPTSHLLFCKRSSPTYLPDLLSRKGRAPTNMNLNMIRVLQILTLIVLVWAVMGASLQVEKILQVRFTTLFATSLVREKAKAPTIMKAIVVRALQILALIALVSAVTGAAIQDQTETAEWRADDTVTSWFRDTLMKVPYLGDTIQKLLNAFPDLKSALL
ncbi:hypothetical protein ISCGN_029464 [Ixodes scapularis]